MSRLHVFDMDGTLLRGTTASLEIARRLGCATDLVRLEESFAAGAVDPFGFASEVCRLWRGLTPRITQEVFDRAPWIGGLHEVLADIRRRGERSVVVTLSPDFFADRLAAFGVDEVVASRFPTLPLTTAPDPAGILAPGGKVTAVDRIRRVQGIDRNSCVAYGDSGSDIPLFRELGHTVAVNATASLRELARFHYDGDDLREAYRLARADPPTPDPVPPPTLPSSKLPSPTLPSPTSKEPTYP
ncbi:HAD-IB family phosphatase [Streptomyces sp. NBC_01356]|uniref:HAD family hydrolase n=1 Tax=Streptomyces sp. NBC_01356 TaxID=2903836 RepID=UPI002E359555|nr:HAD-IB family phosphatase [Streptomyces sp. NBC_01356]